jgi:glycosyltransferase 2 family protein
MKKIPVKKIIDIATGLLSLLALSFVFQRFYTNQVWKLNLLSPLHLAAIILIGSLVYFVDTGLPAVSWNFLMEWFAEPRRPFSLIYSIYGRTQIAKYLPGNIFQLTNRHVLSLNEGYKNSSLLGGAVFEILGSIVGSTVFCLIGYLMGVRYEGLSIFLILGIIVLVFGAVAGFIYIIPRILPRIPFLNKFIPPDELNSKGSFRGLLPVAGLICSYFFVASIIFCFITVAVNGSLSGVSIPLVISVYSIAFLLGLITPGAPAGLGIRETIMVLMLGPMIGDSKATYISLVFRLVTTLGDVWFYLAATLVNVQRRNSNAFEESSPDVD